MNKQDRQGVRTAQDLERKYNLGQFAQGGSDDNSDQIRKVVQELSEHKTNVNRKIDELEERVTTEEAMTETLRTEMDAVEALAAANQAAINATYTAIDLKASKTELEAVSGRVTVLEVWRDDIEEASSEDISGMFS